MKILDIIKKTKLFNEGTINDELTCSIVGNSGCLLEQKSGKIIDQNNAVIRFNSAVTEGYEEFVGSKTTHRVLNCHYILNIDSESYYNHQKSRFPTMDRYFAYKLENQKLVFKTNPSWELWRKKEILNKMREKNEVYFLDQEFYNLGVKLNNGKEPSNGFIGIMMALKHYQQISCFGFSFYSKSSKGHYYDEIKDNSVFKNHDFDNEKRIFELLEKNSLLKRY